MVNIVSGTCTFHPHKPSLADQFKIIEAVSGKRSRFYILLSKQLVREIRLFYSLPCYWTLKDVTAALSLVQACTMTILAFVMCKSKMSVWTAFALMIKYLDFTISILRKHLSCSGLICFYVFIGIIVHFSHLQNAFL